ncbi:alkaline phosphatase-like [Amphiura filiformis]|uniref:alkaline phosphatase-like n=1 Tax=Amphiura filiformis TaxID=82378 RepID=UPI003B2119BC
MFGSRVMTRLIYICRISFIPVLISTILAGQTAIAQPAEFWNAQAKDTLENALKAQRLNLNVAKNVILFIGDGMDISTSTAARIRKGQLAGQPGEEASLQWEHFPHVALSKTYNTDLQVGDSAGTATAFLCGVKSKSGTLGLDDRVQYGNCSSGIGGEVDSILKVAQKAGKSTGFVSTTRVTHATPAGLYAHTPHRAWEYKNRIPTESQLEGCKDIAVQLIENGKDINVIMGGGRGNFMTNYTKDPEETKYHGRRRDNRDLIEEWIALRPDKDRSRYVWNLTEFNKVDERKVDYLLGLFEYSHMQYESARENDKAGEPSLSEMTEKAIKILQKNKNGFFLLAEGGRIDHGHHKGVAYDALHDTLALDKAVSKAMELCQEDDTLIIVTADHGHVMTIAGYPSRGNPILGLHDSYIAKDDMPYTTLSYANGPGGLELTDSFNEDGTRRNLTEVDTEDEDFIQSAAVPLSDETHGGQDVAIYAYGPMAHLFHGVHEQHYIAHVMMYAACLGKYTEKCEVKYQEQQVMCGGSSCFKSESLMLLIVMFIMFIVTTLSINSD